MCRAFDAGLRVALMRPALTRLAESLGAVRAVPGGGDERRAIRVAAERGRQNVTPPARDEREGESQI